MDSMHVVNETTLTVEKDPLVVAFQPWINILANYN